MIQQGWPIVAMSRIRATDRQVQNASKGYISRQEMTPEIAYMHLGRLHNGKLWMQSDLCHHRLHNGAHFNQRRLSINATFGQLW